MQYLYSISLLLYFCKFTLICSLSIPKGATKDFSPLRAIPPKMVLDLVSNFYKSTNIRGGNSQFKVCFFGFMCHGRNKQNFSLLYYQIYQLMKPSFFASFNQYIPPTNYREVYVYQLSQFEGNQKIKEFVDAALSKKNQKRNDVSA